MVIIVMMIIHHVDRPHDDDHRHDDRPIDDGHA